LIFQPNKDDSSELPIVWNN